MAASHAASLTRETVRNLVGVYLGFELDDAQLARLMPRVVEQQEVSRQLEALDLGDFDPSDFHYLHDRRLPR